VDFLTLFKNWLPVISALLLIVGFYFNINNRVQALEKTSEVRQEKLDTILEEIQSMRITQAEIKKDIDYLVNATN